MARKILKSILLSSLIATAPLHAQDLNQRLLNTDYGRQALPVLSHLQDRVKKGELREVFETPPKPGLTGYHNQLTGEYSAGPQGKPDYLIKKTHEGIHDLQHLGEKQSATRLEEFLTVQFRGVFLGKEAASNEKILASLPKFVDSLSHAEKQACLDNGKMNASRAVKLLTVKINEFMQQRRQAGIIQEIHANLFSHAGALSHRDFYERLLFEYPRVMKGLSMQDYSRIKTALLGLYLAYNDHKKVAFFVGRHGRSIEKFLKEAEKTCRGFSQRQIEETDEKRRKMIEEALKTMRVEKAKNLKDLMKALEGALNELRK